MRFALLPGSLAEVDAVAALWNRAKRETVRLTGAEATEAAFKTRAAGHRVLHVATHGFFLGGECAPAARENPLLRSGLLLAGANQRDAAAADGEDGVLTAEEVAALNLTGVEWAVLSGCDTGAGEIRAGEGVFGLRRAFQLAGAKTVVMSLWPVEDLTTRQWMTALYENRLRRNMSTADAVREASVSTLRERRAAGASTHPLYWAAFVATGDWR
jgi:CHAT domain-containing protein